MAESVIVAIISGLLTLAGTALAVYQSAKKTKKSYEVTQAVMQEQIAKLTEEVQKHNKFGEIIPKLEEKVNSLNERVRRLEDK